MSKTTDAFDKAVRKLPEEFDWDFNSRLAKATKIIAAVALSAGGISYIAHNASTDHVAPIEVDGKHRVINAGELNSGTGTVWDIAQAAEPGQDVTTVVNEIEAALKQEGLDPDILTPGQPVPLPLDAEIGHVVDGTPPTPAQ